MFLVIASVLVALFFFGWFVLASSNESGDGVISVFHSQLASPE